MVPPDIENMSVSCDVPSSTSKTTSELDIESCQQEEEQIEDIEFNDQDEEEEENSLLYEDNGLCYFEIVILESV